MAPSERKPATTGSVSQSFVFDWFFLCGFIVKLSIGVEFWFILAGEDWDDDDGEDIGKGF